MATGEAARKAVREFGLRLAHSGDVRAVMEVTGTVQGVGFRPFVYRLASQLGLAGEVRNEGAFVRIVVQGPGRFVTDFSRRLVDEAPSAARIEEITFLLETPSALDGFRIASSAETFARAALSIPADLAICPECRRDMQDPHSRYYRYPFTSCTQCGPRYTISQRLPFDRETTAMNAFPLCSACLEDYRSPLSRRFHAQATACRHCGPELQWLDLEGTVLARGEEALARAKALLRDGKIVAVMGIGGFHLAVNARDEGAVARLRQRKHRPAKPLAVMMPESEVERHCALDAEEWRELCSAARPIVLLRRRKDSGVAPSVAPGMARLGVMLPYTGIQVLLLEDQDLDCLVMTSGNRSGEPLSYTVPSALRELAPIADGFLAHTRQILRPVDDSVVRLDEGGSLLLRLSRGFVPESFAVEGCDPGLTAIALGGDVKNAFALLRDGRIWLGPHIGDLEAPPAFELFIQELDWYRKLLGVDPGYVVHDLHPSYRSTQYARGRQEELLSVQHHHAHIAACLLEHGVEVPVLGIALDGVGYGDDGGIWGGELLLATMASYERLGHLRPLRIIGGDVATKEPWRLVVTYLAEIGQWDSLGDWALERTGAQKAAADRLIRVLRSGFPGVVGTSAGRLFDAAGALVVRQGIASFEGELPMRLEALVEPGIAGAYPFVPDEDGSHVILDYRPALIDLVRELRQGVPPEAVATRFHRGFALALAGVAKTTAARLGVHHVALGGGVWQNEWLLRWFTQEMRGSGLELLVPRRFPVGDGGIAIGQLAVLIATRQSASESSRSIAWR